MHNDRWSSIRSDALCLRAWDDEDEAVAYNGITGETHRIGALEHALLGMMRSPGFGARSSQELARQCAPWFEHDDVLERERFVHQTLAYLEVAGLVARRRD